MGADAGTQELRALVRLANKLRDYAAQTDDAHYVAMFLAAAETLESRATAPGFHTAHTDTPRLSGADDR